MCTQWPKGLPYSLRYFHSYFPNLEMVKKSSLGNLEEVCVFEVKWQNANFIASNPILELVSYL